MAEVFNHVCIKPVCGKQYQDNDPDPYYCPECKEKAQAIAKQIEAKLAGRPRKPIKSDLQLYYETCKAKGTKFISARDIGL